MPFYVELIFASKAECSFYVAIGILQNDVLDKLSFSSPFCYAVFY